MIHIRLSFLLVYVFCDPRHEFFFPTEQRHLLYDAAGRTLGVTQETVSNIAAPSPSPAKWMFTVGGGNKMLCRF